MRLNPYVKEMLFNPIFTFFWLLRSSEVFRLSSRNFHLISFVFAVSPVLIEFTHISSTSINPEWTPGLPTPKDVPFVFQFIFHLYAHLRLNYVKVEFEFSFYPVSPSIPRHSNWKNLKSKFIIMCNFTKKLFQ